jgi:hypothetical protein
MEHARPCVGVPFRSLNRQRKIEKGKQQMKIENKTVGIYFTSATKKISKGNFVGLVILNICYSDRLPNGRFIESKVYWDSAEYSKPYATRSRASTAAKKTRQWYAANRDPLAHRLTA